MSGHGLVGPAAANDDQAAPIDDFYELGCDFLAEVGELAASVADRLLLVIPGGA